MRVRASGGKPAIIMYMSGDNNLKPYIRREARKAVSEAQFYSDVNLAIEVDAGNTERIILRDGVLRRVPQPEADMIDPEHLRDFLLWATSSVPSKEYVLILSSHSSYSGNIIKDKVSPSLRETILRFLGLTKSFMPYKKFLKILKDVQLNLRSRGKQISVLLVDACSMGTAEFIYELSGIVPFIVASPLTIGATGISISRLIQSINWSGASPSDMVSSQTGYPAVEALTAVNTELFKYAMDELASLLDSIERKYPDAKKRMREIGERLRKLMNQEDSRGVPIGGVDLYELLRELGEAFPEEEARLLRIRETLDQAILNYLNPKYKVLLAPRVRGSDLDRKLKLRERFGW